MTVATVMKVVWRRQGHVDWQDDWVKRYGYSRESIPGFDEHISFANYELTGRGLPPMVRLDGGELAVVFEALPYLGNFVPEETLALAKWVCDKHGFDTVDQ